MKIKLAILDEDSNYINKLVAALNNNYFDNLEIYSFTNKDSIVQNVTKNNIDILIVDNSIDVNMESISAQCGVAWFVQSNDNQTIESIKTICKYQKPELIYKEILNMYADISGHYSSKNIGKVENKNIITFMSAAGGVGNTTVALSFCEFLSKIGKKVLYLDLQLLGNTSLYLNAEGQHNFSEILCAIKSKKTNLSIKLESSVKTTFTGISFYESCDNAMEMTEINKEDIKVLIREIRNKALYDYIVIDADFGLDEKSMKIMNESGKLIFISDGTQVSNIKFYRALDALKVLEYREQVSIKDRIYLIYNKFEGNQNRVMEDMQEKTLGGIPRIEGINYTSLIQNISCNKFFEKILSDG